MNRIADEQVIRDVFLQELGHNQDIVVLRSDPRGFGSMTPFVKQRPKQFVETGITKQDLVTTGVRLARCGKEPFVVSPVRSLSTRSMRQAKVDVAYNHASVKLIGTPGDVSYDALDLMYHSTNNIAVMTSVVNVRVHLLSGRLQTECLIRALPKDGEPVYIRVGCNVVEDVYKEGKVPPTLNRATLLRDGTNMAIVTCGEMVPATKQVGEPLEQKGVSTHVFDVHCLKPIDWEAVLKVAREIRGIVTIEEHTASGELGSMVSQIVCVEHPVRVKGLTLLDEPVITGKSQQVFGYYGLNVEGVVRVMMELI